MNDPLRVGLLFGGRSVEHEVSVESARGVAAALRQTRLTCVPLGVTGEGTWLPPDVSGEILASGRQRVEATTETRILIEPGVGLCRVGPGGETRALEVDVIFPLVHGWGGEDGRLQGMLESAAIPYVGSGVLGSAAAMDKDVAKVLMRARGLPVLPWLTVVRADYAARAIDWHRRIVSEFDLPIFVKPANGGSSVGVSRVTRETDLPAALDEAFSCDEKVVVEPGIVAREIECAVLGNDQPEASLPGEIVPSREFYDYAAKYLDGTTELVIPAPLGAETDAAVRRHSVEAFRALELRGFARVDFLIDRGNGGVFVNEINTLPGFTPISMFPKLWEASGLAYPGLIERLVALALERSRVEEGRRTQWRMP